MKKYDYIVVGGGLFGLAFAYLAKQANKSVLIIDKRKHLGGNVYCENKNGIIVHKYGAHIFHTNDKQIWDFVNSLCPFDNYTHSPKAKYNGKIYSLPFNMNTFVEMWGNITIDEAKEKIKEQASSMEGKEPQNLEEQAISLVGTDIYNMFIKDYTEKQWGRSCKELHPYIIKRIPLRFEFNNNYFNDCYSGIPIGGYNNLIKQLSKGCDIMYNTNFNENRELFLKHGKKIIYTGCIDELFDYELGSLEYRSLMFHEELLDINDFQGCSVINYNNAIPPYTRIIEHKHFDKHCKNKSQTIITKEYPIEWTKDKEPYYPIDNERNSILYKHYLELVDRRYNGKLLVGGRLGYYKYFDMDNAIKASIELFYRIK